MEYKDRTFCAFDDCDKWPTCPRALTEEVKQAAGDWWERAGGSREDAPISLYANKPKCFSAKNTERGNT